MKQAPFQLLDYWVDFIQVRTNKHFDSNKPADLDVGTIDLQSEVQQVNQEKPEENGTLWLVQLRIEQPLGDNQNIPYTYSLEIEGLVAAHPNMQGEELKQQIQVNGPSMLFGSAREIIRAATGRGRFAPIIIPSTNFFSRLPEKQAKATPELSVSTEPPRHETTND